MITPKTLVFPRMELKGYDHAPPIVVGTGEVHMNSMGEFAYSLTGTPADIPYAFREMNRQRENPYDGLAMFRLVGDDLAGIKWAGGYTNPRPDVRGTQWTFTGTFESLTADDSGDSVSKDVGVELLFPLRVGDPMSFHLARYVRSDLAIGAPRFEYETEILGSKIRFVYERDNSTLLVTASLSEQLSPPFAENWLSEPLRILFGQLIFPRLVARNLGKGRAWVSVRRSPDLVSGAGWTALWGGKNSNSQDNCAFWSSYAALLRYIALDRAKSGTPNFEANKITRLYEECIQAARGSRWVWALTFASSIEGLTSSLIQHAPKPSAEETAAYLAEVDQVEKFIKYIQGVPGEDRHKKIAAGALRRSVSMTTIRALRRMKAAGIITEEQLSAWEAMRHAVMHGSLVSPYSTKEEDEKLLALAEMMHALTRELLRRTAIVN
ncbi:MAG: hypothetical protein WB764_22810 [Xanthobacteraceae bacterium]